MCPCSKSYATVELKGAGRVLVCEDCAAMLEMVSRLMGAGVKRRPVLGIVPSGSVE
jgi:hypothetical protein